MNKKWSECADSEGNILCLMVRYPWPLLMLFRNWALNREPELDAAFERDAQPLLQRLLEESGLVWNDKKFGDIALSTFIAYYVYGGVLITPACCYTQIPENIERFQVPLTAIP